MLYVTEQMKGQMDAELAQLIDDEKFYPVMDILKNDILYHLNCPIV